MMRFLTEMITQIACDLRHGQVISNSTFHFTSIPLYHISLHCTVRLQAECMCMCVMRRRDVYSFISILHCARPQGRF